MVDLELGTHIHSAPDCSTINQFSSILCSFATRTNGGIVTLAQCIWMLCKNVCQWDNSSQCTKLLKFIRIFFVLLLLSFRSFMFPPGNDNLNLESKFHCELANLLQLTFFCTMDIIRIWIWLVVAGASMKCDSFAFMWIRLLLNSSVENCFGGTHTHVFVYESFVNINSLNV